VTAQRGERRPWLFLLPAMLSLVAVAIVPLVYAIYIAVHGINLTMPYLGEPFVGFDNFREVFTEPRSLNALLRTLIFLVVTVIPELIFGLLLSWSIHQGCSIRERVWITVLLVLPMAIPKVVGGLIWKVLYDPLVGPINFVLQTLNLPAPAWLGDPRFALISVGIVDIWQWTPFMILILLAGLESQPRELFEAANLDGANEFQQFWSVALPLLRPFIAIAVLFRALDAMRTFDYFFTLTQGGPGRVTETVDLYAYAIGISESGDISKATAAALVLLIITTILGTIWAKTMKWGQQP
jgi:multiple sugar transport system permease protein